VNCIEVDHDDGEVTAVGVCSRCGAGVCRAHAVIHPLHLTVDRAVNRRVPVEPPARRILCLVCDAAEAARRAAV
jgi:hypothetical protein